MDMTAAEKETQKNIGIFCCYARKDKPLLNELKKHLMPLLREGRITFRADTDMNAGAEWEKEIHLHLNAASIILLLISPDSLASNYWYSIEMRRALERHEAEEVRVIPVLLRASSWQNTPLSKLQVLPNNERPVTEWPKRDKAWFSIAQGIEQVAKERLTRSMTLSRQPQNIIDATRLDSVFPNMAAQTSELSPHSAGKEEPMSDLPNQMRGFEDKWEQEGDKSRIIQKVEWRDSPTSLSAYARYVIGVDIDRSHLTLALADLKEKTIEVEPSHSFDIYAGADVCLKRVADELRTFLERSCVTWEQVIGIGLATPGPLDDDLRKIVSVSQNAAQERYRNPVSQMHDWEGVDIPDTLEHKLKLKKMIPIYLGRDANMGALGESRYGRERETPILVYVKVEIGIGAGIIIKGQLYCGTGAAGELGHIPVILEKGKICACGNRGCLETVAATPAIVKNASAGISLRTSNANSLQTPILVEQRERGDITEVIQAALHDDVTSQAALKRAGAYIGRALGGIINYFSPSMILFDGEVVHSDYLFDSLKNAAKESSLHMSWKKAHIKLHTLDWPVVVGAIDNAINRISNPSS